MSYVRWYKAQCLYTKQRFAKGVQRNITDFLKASITTDSIKIFSITFCTLVTVYCTCKTAKDAFTIVLYVYVTTFYMQHCAVARFFLCTNLRSRIKKQRKQTREILKGQKSLSSLPLLMGIAMGFWWENALKAFFLGNLACAQKTRWLHFAWWASAFK